MVIGRKSIVEIRPSWITYRPMELGLAPNLWGLLMSAYSVSSVTLRKGLDVRRTGGALLVSLWIKRHSVSLSTIYIRTMRRPR